TDMEKSRWKTEGDNKTTVENLNELEKMKSRLGEVIKKWVILSVSHRLSYSLLSQPYLPKTQMSHPPPPPPHPQVRIEELEEELETERAMRAKVEKQRSELSRELDDLTDRLEEAGGATASQVEVNKKREAELQRLRRELEESSVQSEALAAALRKRHGEALTELGEQCESLQRTRAKLEKEKQNLRLEVDHLAATVDSLQKAKVQTDTLSNAVFIVGPVILTIRQLEEAENRVSQMNRAKTLFTSQNEELKKQLEEEIKAKAAMASTLGTMRQDCELLKEQLEEEQESKMELQRQVSKLNSEVTHWRTRYEADAIQHTDELEEAKKKLASRLQEAEEAVEATQAKCSSLEKTKQRLQGEVEDLCIDLEKANSSAMLLDKKQRVMEKQLTDWRQKCEDLVAEVESCQKESRQHSTELFKLKTTYEETLEQGEVLRRENKAFQEEMADLNDQLAEVGKTVHELQKAKKKMEMEKEELQASLEESEAALEAEETKVLRLQLELSQAKGDLERRLQEKEEEFEATRKSHQRALESLQASLDAEVKGRTEGARVKKKLETDVNELELQLDLLTKNNGELMKTIKKMQQQIKDLQAQVEEDSRRQEEMREEQALLERRCAVLSAEVEETRAGLEAAERSRKALEVELQETAEKFNDINTQAATSGKRKLETDLQQLTQDHEELQAEVRASNDKAKKAMSEAGRLAEELRHEQEHTLHLERVKKGLEAQVKDMTVRVDEAEQLALKGGKKIIQKLEGKVKELELELDAEQKRHGETLKTLRKNERRLKELLFQSEEDQKNQQRMQDLVERLQNKMKAYKRQVEEAEEQANMNLAKYRKTVHELDDAEERADIAESALTKIRTKRRGSFSKGYSSVTPYAGLVRSPSSAGSEGRGEKIINDDDTVSSLIPAYLDSLKKLMIDD
uniref:Myosin-16-like n=1 Tax=Scleropages formosus TaxID=113540 RepID=A0A8C9SKF6_SCLFO